MTSPNLIRKISPRQTLLGFEVGQSHVFKDSQCRYTTLYPTIRRLEKSTDMRFEITIRGVDGTYVKRIR